MVPQSWKCAREITSASAPVALNRLGPVSAHEVSAIVIALTRQWFDCRAYDVDVTEPKIEMPHRQSSLLVVVLMVGGERLQNRAVQHLQWRPFALFLTGLAVQTSFLVAQGRLGKCPLTLWADARTFADAHTEAVMLALFRWGAHHRKPYGFYQRPEHKKA